jgi:hypothetical protein
MHEKEKGDFSSVAKKQHLYLNGEIKMDIKKAIKPLVELFDLENLTPFQIENSGYSQSTQAKVIHAFIGSIDYQIKGQNNYIGNTLSPNLAKAYESSNCTDTHEDYINSLIQQIKNAELCIESMLELSRDLKDVYLENIGEVYRPYKPADKQALGKAMSTASRLEAKALLEKMNVKVSNPALEEVLAK